MPPSDEHQPFDYGVYTILMDKQLALARDQESPA